MRLCITLWIVFLALLLCPAARAQPPQAPAIDYLPRKEPKKDFTPPRDKLAESIERLMITKDQDAAIAKAEADGVLWVRWTYWPDSYDGSTELFNSLPNARHVLKADPDGDEFIQFRGTDGVKWMKAHRIDLVGGRAVAAGIKAASAKKAAPASHGESEKVTIDGNIYDKFPDGRLAWCEHCNGGPDPDPARTARLNKGKVETTPPVAKATTKVLTYAEAYAKAKGDGKKTKPLIIWVGGNFCERCVQESENDFVHYFADSWPGMRAPSILVGVWDEGQMKVAGKIDWWLEGSPTFGHIASINDTIRKWRDERNEGKMARVAAPRASYTGGFSPVMQPMMVQSQPVMRAAQPMRAPMAPQSFGGVSMGVPRRGG